ncbi:hypothetical protein CHS0354_004874 [Potamilus streckersoni]|uniref:Uridylate-specific endoribonuclease n=1 Tax=Potamilus streckersoni TaxID=2493646 RepID=A0AAE0SIM5_9BIVA|nr:hypothetical protein CHS0354_004874 [Potamilus streckersoni]
MGTTHLAGTRVFILGVISIASTEALLLSGTAHGPVSDSELSVFMNSLWSADVNRASANQVTTNIQSHTDSNSTVDRSPERLFTLVDENLFNRSTYAAFLNLLDNYDHLLGHAEQSTPQEESEISHFLNEISQTEIMQKTVHFLREKGYIASAWSELESLIRQIWFTSFARHVHSHVKESSAFEHVFVGEYTQTVVEGFHNWIEFYLQEKAGNLNYLGYLSVHKPNIIGVHFTWHGRLKQYNAIIYGTSPEFDLAMYTVCFVLRHNRKCSFQLDGHPVSVHSFDLDRDGVKLIGTVYLDV